MSDLDKPDWCDKVGAAVGAILRDYWHHLVAACVGGLLAYLSKPGDWRLSVAGVVVAAGTSIVKDIKSGSYSKMRNQLAATKAERDAAVASLREQTTVTTEMVRDFVRGYLANLGDEVLGFDDEQKPTRRLTLYSRGGDGRLHKVARHTGNPDWAKGRQDISADHGITATAWRDAWAFQSNLPDPATDPVGYVQSQVGLGMDEKDAQDLTMPARLYCAVRVQERFAKEPMAVLVFECTEPQAFTEDELKRKLTAEKREQYRTQIVKLVHEHFPDPAEAARQGF